MIRKYYNTITFETHEIEDNLYNMWIEVGNPKANVFSLIPEPPVFDEETEHEPIFEQGTWIKNKKSEKEIADLKEEKKIKNNLTLLSQKNGEIKERIERIEESLVFLIKKCK